MPIVDLKEVEKKVKKAEEDKREIQTREIGGKTYFRGKYLGDDAWFTDYQECLNANQVAKSKEILKEAGLNEFGQSPEIARLAKKKAELFKVKKDLLEQVAGIDQKIAILNRGGDIEEEKEEKDEKPRGFLKKKK